MATSVTLTAVSITTEKNYISCINSNDYKNQENIISPITNKSVERRMPSSKQSLIKSAIKTDNSLNQSLPKFRIPKITSDNRAFLFPCGELNSSFDLLIDKEFLSLFDIGGEVH
ncbi:unnamed protein product, partial [Rotaria sp. Silwood2]